MIWVPTNNSPVDLVDKARAYRDRTSHEAGPSSAAGVNPKTEARQTGKRNAEQAELERIREVNRTLEEENKALQEQVKKYEKNKKVPKKR